jgi:hypothetical protein
MPGKKDVISKQVEDPDSSSGFTIIRVPKLRMARIHVRIRGLPDVPYVQNAMSGRIIGETVKKHEAGGAAKAAKQRPKRDFKREYEESSHFGPLGERGIPSQAFRQASVSACRAIGIKMTHAKLAIFPVQQFIDPKHGHGLISIKGRPRMTISNVRNQGPGRVFDLRARPFFYNWRAEFDVDFDSGMISQEHVLALLERAGIQVGIGAGRPDSRDSTGCGWGLFELVP